MPAIKTGRMLTCMICGTEFYRRGSYIRRGIKKTCGKRECKSASMCGANNPFWGKDHTPESIALINAAKRSRPHGKGGQKGYKHTPEARAKMSEALRVRWRDNRDKMLSYHPASVKPREEQRYRRNFTPAQRIMWKAECCAWCKSADNLILDHIIPVICGGKKARENAQTLCQPCNVWKMLYVDRPLFLAGLGS